jgi:excisionase family DNA binding protein
VNDDEHERPWRALLLRIDDAAQLLAIGRTTMYGLIAAGEIELVHIGRSARVPFSELERYVERRRVARATVRSSTRAARAGREPGPGQPTT